MLIRRSAPGVASAVLVLIFLACGCGPQPLSSPTAGPAAAPTATPPPASPPPSPQALPPIRTVAPGATPPRPAAGAPANCASGPPPNSLSAFPPQPSLVYNGLPYRLVGRDLVVNAELVASEGTTSGADLVSVQSQSCNLDRAIRYDWIYTQWYARECPDSLSDFETPESGPWGLTVVGRQLYLSGDLVESEGETSEESTEENGTCDGRPFRYVVYWTGATPTPVPEASTLLLLGSGLGWLAGWIAWQRRRRT